MSAPKPWIFLPALFSCLAALLLGSGPGGQRPHVGTYAEYAVAADQPLASRAGAEVLAKGGSAADAAAATMLALGVTSPASSGLGGGGFALYYDAAKKSFTYIDFRERAPAASTKDMFEDAEARTGEGPLAQPSQIDGLASGVPGEPAGIAMLLERFGKIDRKEVVAPALALARDGFEVSTHLAEISVPFAAQMKRDRTMRAWFGRGKNALDAGQVLKQPELARSLEDFARSGAESFYRGRIARAIVRANKKAGGVMTAKDLADYRPALREPLTAEHFGYRFVTAPPPSAGGFTMLESLGLLERWQRHWKGRGRAALLHAQAESWKGPFMDRKVFAGDPDHVDVPVKEMLSDERLDARSRAFHPTLAMPARDFELPIEGHPERPAVQPEGGGTSHLCVIDAEGNVASITTTVNLPFGARYTAAGIVMNDEMDDFARELDKKNAFGLPGGAPNLPGPGRRPVSTMSPTIVLDSEGVVLCVGASGGSRIVTATEQVAFNVTVLGMGVDEAVEAPRIHHQGIPVEIRTEEFRGIAPEVLAALEARGHVHKPIANVATVQAIEVQRRGGRRLVAVSDPRKGGQPAGK